MCPRHLLRCPILSSFKKAMVSKEPRTWDDYSKQHRSKLVKEVSETIMSKCASQEEAVAFVSAVVKKT